MAKHSPEKPSSSLALHYTVDASRTHEHVFSVSLTLPKPAPEVILRLPVWIPGSYLVREFARHILRITARQGKRPVPITQLDKSGWQVACTGRGDLVVSYEVYAFDTSVRAAYLDQHRGFFNNSSLLLSVAGRELAEHRLTLLAPPKQQRDWRVATALPAVPKQVDAQGFGTYTAASYDELIDHPVELGRFWQGEFKAHGVPHVLAVSGAGPRFDSARLLADTQRICEANVRFWHPNKGEAPPFKRYVFLLNVTDDGYGGLEHRASTALIAARRDLPRLGDKQTPEGYTTLLGLISHEYFHTWNVKRLKPREFVPYDLSRENYTELLWFFEGFTSYYDDLLLVRAGLVDGPSYVKLLTKTIQQVAATPGQRISSVAQASMDAWLKYYRPDENTPNATVSYYTKGALVALCLDLSLRTEGRTTLDEVMRALWARCAPEASPGAEGQNPIDRPMSEDDLRTVLHELGGRSFDAELDAWVHGTTELPLEALLKSVGVSTQHEPPTLAQRLGVRAVDAASGVQIKAVFSGSPAQAAGLAAGDELLAITPLARTTSPRTKTSATSNPSTWRLRKLDDWALYSPTDNPLADVELLVARDQQVQRLRLKLPATLGSPKLAMDTQAEPAALKRLAAWLG